MLSGLQLRGLLDRLQKHMKKARPHNLQESLRQAYHPEQDFMLRPPLQHVRP